MNASGETTVIWAGARDTIRLSVVSPSGHVVQNRSLGVDHAYEGTDVAIGPSGAAIVAWSKRVVVREPTGRLSSCRLAGQYLLDVALAPNGTALAASVDFSDDGAAATVLLQSITPAGSCGVADDLVYNNTSTDQFTVEIPAFASSLCSTFSREWLSVPVAADGGLPGFTDMGPPPDVGGPEPSAPNGSFGVIGPIALGTVGDGLWLSATYGGNTLVRYFGCDGRQINDAFEAGQSIIGLSLGAGARAMVLTDTGAGRSVQSAVTVQHGARSRTRSVPRPAGSVIAGFAPLGGGGAVVMESRRLKTVSTVSLVAVSPTGDPGRPALVDAQRPYSFNDPLEADAALPSSPDGSAAVVLDHQELAYTPDETYTSEVVVRVLSRAGRIGAELPLLSVHRHPFAYALLASAMGNRGELSVLYDTGTGVDLIVSREG